MKNFIARLSSRKFLITIVLIVAITLWPDMPDAVITLALTYIGAEGLRDVVTVYKDARVGTAAVEKDIALIQAGFTAVGDDIEKGSIVPGKQ